MRSIWPAALVHVFTASGAVCAFFAIRSIIEGRWELMFAWLGLALVIDGIDGTFARLADVQTRLPRFSGERLDLVVDYLTYVLVPALALWQAGFFGGVWTWLGPSLILLSSLFHFSDVESKADDYAFVGFPAIWNVVAFYLFALQASQAVATLTVLALVALTFVPLKWVHPLRTPFARTLTLAVCAVWGLAAAWTLWRGFPATPVAAGLLLASALYGGVLTWLEGRAR
ncbi:MAG: CDP-alcohol phosphatidyltransferase family protein [Hyphomicrobiaceae bacterium]|nr:CDP-alcohol phosphatidyltransferase family protein [Hyphomicrobiaceae bacterium]